jgi:site-specific recombinase XerD
MRKLPVWLTETERDRLLKVETSVRNRAIVTTFLYAGIRCNELRMLDVGDIDFEEMTIHVRHAKRDKERYIPLHPDTAIALDSHLGERKEDFDDALFMSNRGERISNRRLRSMVKMIGKRAGIRKNLHPHALRHTFAVMLKDNGEDLETIRELLGHEDIQTTSIYLHCSMAGKRLAIERL